MPRDSLNEEGETNPLGQSKDVGAETFPSGGVLCFNNLLARGSGCIINISSGAGVSGPRNRSAYSASKHGVMGFTKVLVTEYLRQGIRSHVILPDATVSQMRTEGFPDEDPESLIQAEDIADAAVFLATQKTTAHTMELRVSQGLATRYK